MLCIILLVCMVGSTTTYHYSLEKRFNNQYIGVSHNKIVRAFGAPDRETTDGADGDILIYEHSTVHSKAAAYNVNPISGTYTPGVYSQQKIDYVHFYIDKNHNCYKVKTNLVGSYEKTDKTLTFWCVILSIVGIVGLMVAAANYETE